MNLNYILSLNDGWYKYKIYRSKFDETVFLCEEVKSYSKNIKLFVKVPEFEDYLSQKVVCFEFDLNTLDPIDDAIGFKQRLNNLDFYNRLDQELEFSIYNFRETYSLESSEELKNSLQKNMRVKMLISPFKDKLEEVHGS